MKRQIKGANELRPALQTVNEETAALFADLIGFQTGMEAALKVAASEKKAEIEAIVDYYERRLL